MTQSEISNEELRELLVRLGEDPKNEDLWKALYHHIRRFVYAVAYRVLNGNEELAKDATQVVFLRLFEYCEFTEFSEPQEFLGYVATVARHAALDHIKSEGRYVTGLDLTLCDFLPGTPTPHLVLKTLAQDGELDGEKLLLFRRIRLPETSEVLYQRRIDKETKLIEFSGIMRRYDITADNSISSELVANAKVSYVGNGPLTDSTNRKGLGALIHGAIAWVWPF